MAPRLALLAALAGATVAVAADAATVIVPILSPMDEPDVELVGSVISAKAGVTTYAVGCASDYPYDSCPLGGASWTVVQGPSTHSHSAEFTQMLLDGEATYTQQASCVVDVGMDQAECLGSYTETRTGKVTTSGIHEHLVGYKDLLHPLFITAGAEKLPASVNATETGDSSAAKSTQASGGSYSLLALPTLTATGSFVPTDTPTDKPTTGSAAASTAAATTTKTGNAAGSRVTRNGFLAGVAVAIGGGALLL